MTASRLFTLTAAAVFACGALISGCNKQANDAPPADPGSAGPAGPAGAGEAAATLPDGDPAAVAVKNADPTATAALRAALDGKHRPPENAARDKHRHPFETLTFFGLRPDMTVVELWPGGGGWYTEVLAPVLRERGKLITTNFDTSGPADSYGAKAGKKFQDKLAGNPGLYDKVQVVTVKDPAALTLAPDGTVDLIVTFRNTHGWAEDGIEAGIYSAAFRALKPGGVFGVVQHRANPGPVTDIKKQAATGYLPEDWVVERVQAAGFKLAEKSEVNANPKDTKDYEKGVWALPPALDNGETDKAKYVAIGESDRMTLKFVKP